MHTQGLLNQFGGLILVSRTFCSYGPIVPLPWCK